MFVNCLGVTINIAEHVYRTHAMPPKSNNNALNNEKKRLAEVFIGYLTSTPPYLMLFHLFWLVVASAALSGAYVVSFHFTSVLGIYQEAHSIRNFGQNLMVSARQDQEIGNSLQNLLTSTKSNRAYVFRYHNGLAAVNSVPFFFQTMTHEVISPGTPRVMRFEQRVPASMNLAVSNRFVQNRCAMVEHTDEDRDSQNYWYFQIRGAKTLVRCPIFMENGDLFGFVGIDYIDGPEEMSLEAVANRAREAAAEMARIFARRP